MAATPRKNGSGKDKESALRDQEEQALAHRGNAGLRKDIKEAGRIYDPAVDKEWKLKYRNFSSYHMRRAVKVFQEARHDPFNKSPEWGREVVRRVGRHFIALGITPEDEYAKLDVSHDGSLERAEVRRMLMEVMPDIGDMEIAAIFEIVDKDHSNDISLEELTSVIWGSVPGWLPTAEKEKRDRGTGGTASTGSDQYTPRGNEDGTGHRTPAYRVQRHPPAQIEGWDHLQQNPKFKREADLLQARENSMFRRCGADLCLSPRPAQELPGTYNKYDHFGGGHDTNRFQKKAWRSHVNQQSEVGSSVAEIQSSIIPDPGGLDIRPGYHIQLTQMAPHLAPSPRRARYGAS